MNVSTLFVATLAWAFFLLPPCEVSAVDLVDGDLVVTDAGEFIGGTSKLVRVRPASGSQATITSDGFLEVPQGVALEEAGTLVVADLQGVIRIDPEDGSQALFVSGGFLDTPTGITIEPTSDDLIVGNSGGLFGGTSRIVRVDKQTGAQSLISSGGFLRDPAGLTMDGDSILVANTTNVLRVNLVSGEQVVLANGGSISNASFVLRESASTILLIDAEAFGSGGVIRIALATGQQTPLFSGGFLANPFGGALASGGLTLTSAESFDPQGGVNGLVEIDGISGGQSVVSQDGLLELPIQMLVVPELDRATQQAVLVMLLALVASRRRHWVVDTAPS